jgi:hypothetical protein
VQVRLAKDELAIAQYGIRGRVGDGSDDLGGLGDRFIRFGGTMAAAIATSSSISSAMTAACASAARSSAISEQR